LARSPVRISRSCVHVGERNAIALALLQVVAPVVERRLTVSAPVNRPGGSGHAGPVVLERPRQARVGTVLSQPSLTASTAFRSSAARRGGHEIVERSRARASHAARLSSRRHRRPRRRRQPRTCSSIGSLSARRRGGPSVVSEHVDITVVRRPSVTSVARHLRRHQRPSDRPGRPRGR
jgi:hypothetical protein